MTQHLEVRSGAYVDSITLMQASRDAEEIDGVAFAAAVSATPMNLELLRARGFVPEGDARPDDLVIAVDAADDDATTAALARIDARLSARGVPASGATPAPVRTLGIAARRDPSLSVAFVSVPGRHAAYEVADALEAGLHVFCFSDGVDIDAEAALKRRAAERKLLLMGPDCGTAIVDGYGLGFANIVTPGPVGIVGASGTGTQEVCCLLDAAGVGISHAIGVGGRDLSPAVGGTMTKAALDLLAADGATEVIVVISKPPDPEVARALADVAAGCGKPVMFGAPGGAGGIDVDGVEMFDTLEGAAGAAARACGAELPRFDPSLAGPPTPGPIRGFFAGGTLCSEVAAVVRAGGGDGEFVDFGADRFTEGRAHPMIDPSLRDDAVRRAAGEGGGVVVLDLVLGRCAHPDPAGSAASAVEAVAASGATPIAIVCGTARDPQGLDDQAVRMASSGALVARSAARAAHLSLAAAGISS